MMDNFLISGTSRPQLPRLTDLASAPPLKQQKPDNYLIAGILLSLILHGLGLSLLFQQPLSGNQMPKQIVVDLLPEHLLKTPPLPEPKKVQPQIVSKTRQKESAAPPKDTHLLSDINTVTEKQQIKRGDHPLAGAAKAGDTQLTPPQKKQAARKEAHVKQETATKTEKRSQAPAIEPKRIKKKLDLSPAFGTLSKINRGEFTKQPSEKARMMDAKEPSPFSRAPGNAVLFSGAPGVSDVLSDISDGDITLLNAKANRFAVFVRRVAVRVFQQIKVDGWDFLRAADFKGIHSYVRIDAVLEADGSLHSVRISNASGSAQFDSIIKGSVSKTVMDPNPPAAARAADGKIHFIFLARSWSDFYAGPRGPAERRWLVLKTGLE